jgi:Tfp pilus assembly protein PilO
MSWSQGLKMGELRGRVRAGFRRAHLSLIEMTFLAAAILFAGLVTFVYLTQIAPRQFTLSGLQQREAAAIAELKRLAKQEKDLQEQRANAQKILDSLKEFEERLENQREGMPLIIEEVLGLAKSNRVIGGAVNFRTIAPDAVDEQGRPIQGRNDKTVSVYPALGLDTTVEGDYHDLRRFISDLERSEQFVIINSVALQSVDEKARRSGQGSLAGPGPAPLQAAAANPATVTVSLKIEMDTYFQKPSAP